MYAVGAKLPFPGSIFEGRKDEYSDSTLLMSLTDSNDVKFFTNLEDAVVFASKEMIKGHSSPKTTLPLDMRAIFWIRGEENESKDLSIKKIESFCLPFKIEHWEVLDFDTSKSIFERDNVVIRDIYPFLYPHQINLTAYCTSKGDVLI